MKTSDRLEDNTCYISQDKSQYPGDRETPLKRKRKSTNQRTKVARHSIPLATREMQNKTITKYFFIFFYFPTGKT